MEFTVDTARAMCPPSATARRRADRPHSGRQPVFAGQEGLLQGREHPRGPGSRLRQADHDDRDRWLDHGRGRRGVRRAHPAGPALVCSSTSTSRRRSSRPNRDRAGLQPGAAQEGRRAGAVGPLGELPEERQHRLHRRPDPEDRSGDAAHSRTSAASRSTRSRKCSPQWACISAWKSRTGRRRTSKISPSATKTSIEHWRRGMLPPALPVCFGRNTVGPQED
jgi:hypothetical protein